MRVETPSERPAPLAAAGAERGRRVADAGREAPALAAEGRRPGTPATAPDPTRPHTTVPAGAGGAPDPTGVSGRRLDAFA
jgi:hypothetical protein